MKPTKETPSDVVNKFHLNSDKDSSTLAHHHTLGPRRNQASPGDHVHDGATSKKIGAGKNLSVSGARDDGTALASLLTMLAKVIEFTDNTTAT